MNIKKLKRLAPKGSKADYMALELGVHPQTVRKAIRRHGLHREWSLARYAKCREVTHVD